jgi:hypothetical protein
LRVCREGAQRQSAGGDPGQLRGIVSVPDSDRVFEQLGAIRMTGDGGGVAHGSMVGVGLLPPRRNHPDAVRTPGGEVEDFAERRADVDAGVVDLPGSQLEGVPAAGADPEASVGDLAGCTPLPEQPGRRGVGVSPGGLPSSSVTANRSMRTSRSASVAIRPSTAQRPRPDGR